MKELYYSKSSINQQAKVFYNKLLSLREKRESHIDRKKVALLVIDCQRFFFDNMSHAFVPSANAILSKIVRLQNYCLQTGIKVIQTQHLNTEEDIGIMNKWWRGRLPVGEDSASEIIDEIQNPQIAVISKSQYDAFYNTKLDEILKADGIEQLIITGVMTHLCCDTTARSAFIHGYEVFFSIDGTATYNREFHMGALINLAHGFAVPMLVEEIMGQLKGIKK